MENQDLQLLKKFEEDSKWFHDNINKLREKFEGRFVAIKNKQPIASDKNIEIVVKAIEEQGENPSYLLIQFVYPKDFLLLL